MAILAKIHTILWEEAITEIFLSTELTGFFKFFFLILLEKYTQAIYILLIS